MSANKKTPRTEYTYKASINIPPTELSDGSVTMKVWKITLILFALLIYLSILCTLKALTNVTADPIFDPPAYTAISAIIERITIIKSNRFHLSLKYSLKPSPTNFSMISTINIKVKM